MTKVKQKGTKKKSSLKDLLLGKPDPEEVPPEINVAELKQEPMRVEKVAETVVVLPEVPKTEQIAADPASSDEEGWVEVVRATEEALRHARKKLNTARSKRILLEHQRPSTSGEVPIELTEPISGTKKVKRIKSTLEDYFAKLES